MVVPFFFFFCFSIAPKTTLARTLATVQIDGVLFCRRLEGWSTIELPIPVVINLRGKLEVLSVISNNCHNWLSFTDLCYLHSR